MKRRLYLKLKNLIIQKGKKINNRKFYYYYFGDNYFKNDFGFDYDCTGLFSSTVYVKTPDEKFRISLFICIVWRTDSRYKRMLISNKELKRVCKLVRKG